MLPTCSSLLNSSINSLLAATACLKCEKSTLLPSLAANFRAMDTVFLICLLISNLLAFSISHDHRSVRIYGHYPIIDGKNTTFHRHPIRTFDVTELEEKEKWTAYKFTRNVYDIWMPAHLKRICSVIDDLPSNVQFEVS